MSNSNLDSIRDNLRDRRLVRSRDDRWVAGVCGGTAAYLGVDANLVRLALVAAVVLGFGTGILLYVAAWFVMPEHP